MNKPYNLTTFYSLFIVLILLAFISCNRKHTTVVQRGFYYWKSDGDRLQQNEIKYLRNLQAKKLYVKYFEVEKDNTLGIIPIAKSNFQYWNSSYDSLSNIEIIPTIYIKNNVFFNILNKGLDSLANNIVFLTDKYYTNSVKDSAQYKELQIDCDWTAKTKDSYFYLLRSLKRQSNKIISCTLRLYPYKYSEKMGIPPVDKVTLMCYNLINPLQNEDKNSILDITELKAYLPTDKKYPIHLDVALPVYSWMQYYHNEEFSAMIYHDNQSILNVLQPIKPLWYTVIKDTVVDNLYLRIGDKIKYEQITPDKLQASIDIIKKNVAFDDTIAVTFFHLEETNLNQFRYETLDSFYTDFSK